MLKDAEAQLQQLLPPTSEKRAAVASSSQDVSPLGIRSASAPAARRSSLSMVLEDEVQHHHKLQQSGETDAPAIWPSSEPHHGQQQASPWASPSPGLLPQRPPRPQSAEKVEHTKWFIDTNAEGHLRGVDFNQRRTDELFISTQARRRRPPAERFAAIKSTSPSASRLQVKRDLSPAGIQHILTTESTLNTANATIALANANRKAAQVLAAGDPNLRRGAGTALRRRL